MPSQPAVALRPRLGALAILAYASATIVAWLLATTVTEKFAEIERNALRADMMRAQDALDARVDALATSAGDWAVWDAPYEFAVDRNQAFIDENTQDAPFMQLGLNLMLILDTEGRPIFSKAFDLQASAAVPVDPVFVDELLRAPGVARHESERSETKGLVRTSRGLAMLCSRPLLKSSGEGPSHGAMVFVRLLDTAEVAQVFKGEHLDLALFPSDSDDAARGEVALAAGASPALVPVSGSTNFAWSAVEDLAGKPAALLQIRQPRVIYKQGKATVQLALVAMAALGGLGTGVLMWLLQRLVGSLSAQSSSEQLRVQFVESCPDAILLVDPGSFAVREANSAAERLLGGNLVGRTIPEVLPSLAEAWAASVPGLVAGARVTVGEIERHGGAKHTHTLELAVAKMEHGTDVVLSVVARDVTEQRRAEAQTRHAAFHDTLTGLPNRALFQARLNEALAGDERSRSLAVAFLDLDGFKEINDTMGHPAADRLLIDVSRRLSSILKPGDTVARHGGDEFLLLTPNLPAPEYSVLIAQRVLDSFAEPFWVDGREVRISASLGLALAPTDGLDAETLVAHADLAMYQAKAAGRGAWELFHPSMQTQAAAALDVRNRLARGLPNDEFHLVYQPQVHLATGRVVGVEALVRWQSSEGVVHPSAFIPVAEETGLIVPLGEWVIQRACADAAAWARDGLPPVRVAVNISPRQLQHEGLVAAVRRALDATGLDPHRLEIEITESVGVREPELAGQVLDQLRSLGVSVALDDFGTGHCSLMYLRMFNIDRLKIDRCFVSGLDGDRHNAVVVAGIVGMGHRLGMEVIAEGVETQAQLDLLRRHGCDVAQGYLLSRPVSAVAIRDLIADSQACFAPRFPTGVFAEH